MLESLKSSPHVFIEKGTKTYPAEMVFHFAEKSHPFVFVPLNDEPTELKDDERKILDAPFQIFSIEMLGDHYLTVGRPGDEVSVKVMCVLAIEQKPREFITIGFAKTESGKPMCILTDSFIPIVNAFLKRIHKEAKGMERVRERIKVGSGKQKRIITIREVIHVRPKKLMEASSPTGRVIDWSHRFEVRSHWRNVQGSIGRDREGNPIPDWTWVKDYVKGPEGAPLITKARVVIGQKERGDQ